MPHHSSRPACAASHAVLHAPCCALPVRDCEVVAYLPPRPQCAAGAGGAHLLYAERGKVPKREGPVVMVSPPLLLRRPRRAAPARPQALGLLGSDLRRQSFSAALALALWRLARARGAAALRAAAGVQERRPRLKDGSALHALSREQAWEEQQVRHCVSCASAGLAASSSARLSALITRLRFKHPPGAQEAAQVAVGRARLGAGRAASCWRASCRASARTLAADPKAAGVPHSSRASEHCWPGTRGTKTSFLRQTRALTQRMSTSASHDSAPPSSCASPDERVARVPRRQAGRRAQAVQHVLVHQHGSVRLHASRDDAQEAAPPRLALACCSRGSSSTPTPWPTLVPTLVSSWLLILLAAMPRQQTAPAHTQTRPATRPPPPLAARVCPFRCPCRGRACRPPSPGAREAR